MRSGVSTAENAVNHDLRLCLIQMSENPKLIMMKLKTLFTAANCVLVLARRGAAGVMGGGGAARMEQRSDTSRTDFSRTVGTPN
jgi:hypothetical protein